MTTPPLPAAWTGTPSAYTALMNTAGFTWNGHAWQWRSRQDPEEQP